MTVGVRRNLHPCKSYVQYIDLVLQEVADLPPPQRLVDQRNDLSCVLSIRIIERKRVSNQPTLIQLQTR